MAEGNWLAEPLDVAASGFEVLERRFRLAEVHLHDVWLVASSTARLVELVRA